MKPANEKTGENGKLETKADSQHTVEMKQPHPHDRATFFQPTMRKGEEPPRLLPLHTLSLKDAPKPRTGFNTFKNLWREGWEESFIREALPCFLPPSPARYAFFAMTLRPAIMPNTQQSRMAQPPRRMAPWTPEAASPAA